MIIKNVGRFTRAQKDKQVKREKASWATRKEIYKHRKKGQTTSKTASNWMLQKA